MKSIIIALLGLSFSGCGLKDKVETSCDYDESHFSFRETESGEFTKSVHFDKGGGVSFRKKDTIPSATDVRENIKFFYEQDSKQFIVESKFNKRVYAQVPEACVLKLKAFLIEAEIDIPIN
jgi:hypothetical protein